MLLTLLKNFLVVNGQRNSDQEGVLDSDGNPNSKQGERMDRGIVILHNGDVSSDSVQIGDPIFKPT